MLHQFYHTNIHITFIGKKSFITIKNPELYLILNKIEENNDTKIVLLIVESIHQVMCDWLFRYRNKLSIPPIINADLFIINTRNDPYDLELIIISYFIDIFKYMLLPLITMARKFLSKMIQINSLAVN